MSNDEVSRIITIVGIITLVVLIALILVVKASGKTKADQKTMSDIANKAKESLIKESNDKDSSIKLCEYCGTQNDQTNIKCTSCGAPLSQRKRK